MPHETSTEESSAGKSKLWSLASKVSSSGFTIIGVLYLIGYVIVNGYQTKSMHYSSSALQLRHITAGALYALLTLSEVLIIASCLAGGLGDWEAWREENQRPKDTSPTNDKTKRKSPVLAFLRIWWQVAFLAGAGVGLVFGIIGVAAMPGGFGTHSGLRHFVPWAGINLFVALLLGGAIHKGYGEQFDEAFRKKRKAAEPETKEPVSPEVQTQVDEALRALRHSFIQEGAQRFLVPVGLTLCALYSLTSFQAVYGRLNPDYGGGALYRVKLPEGGNKLSGAIQEGLDAKDSLLLLADRDDKNICLLRVDKSGTKRVLLIGASEITALEILRDQPMHPDDAVYTLQHPETPVASSD